MPLTSDDILRNLAFDNAAQANIISTAGNGKIIMVNNAACKLLGYSKKELLTQSRGTIFDIKESSFKKMLKQRTAEGHSKALVTAIKKSGKTITCEITSAIFMDVDGIKKAITSIADISQSILKQKNIDVKKEKTVADNIIQAQAKSDARLAENNEWIKYIAKASYDVMWDWDIATGEIYTGDSIEEVFGYKVQNNTVAFTEFINCLLPEEKDTVEKKLRKALASGTKSWNDCFMFKRQDGSVAATTSRASIVRDEDGKAIRLIGAIQDVSRLQELEKKLSVKMITQDNNTDTFFQVANISFDVIWDRNLLTNKVIRGEGFEELLGYPLKDYKGNVSDLDDHIHPQDKKAVLKGLQDAIESSATHWEQAFRIIAANGAIVKVFDRASIFRQSDGKAYRMIGAMQNVSRQKELEEKLEQEIAANEKLLAENNENHKYFFNSADDKLHQQAFDNSIQANIISTVSSGQIISVNNAACKLLGYSKKELLTKTRADIFDINESSFKKMLEQRTAEGKSTALVTIINKKGKPIACEIASSVFTDKDGIEKSITSIVDMTQSILKQKNIDTKKDKLVDDNIALAIAKQIGIDTKNKKLVAGNIALAISNQKDIDARKEKLVADNIVLAILKQQEIDAQKNKIVDENIILAKAKSDASLAESNEIFLLAAKLSADVMWDWNLLTNELFLGDRFEELFGYHIQNNKANIADWGNYLHPEDKEAVEQGLSDAIASSAANWEYAYRFIRADGSIAKIFDKASIMRDADGKAYRMVGVMQDLSRQKELEEKLEQEIADREKSDTTLAESKEKFFLTTKFSSDLLWEWDLTTGEISIGNNIEELFGFALKNKKGKATDWIHHVHPEDKEELNKSLHTAVVSSANNWQHDFRFIRANGSIAYVLGRAVITRHSNGKATYLIGALQDLSKQKELEEKLEKEIADREEYEKKFKLIFNSSADILCDDDLVTNQVILSDAYEAAFGYKIIGNTTSMEDLFSHIHPDDKEAFLQDYQRMLASEDTEWKYNFRFLKADGSVAHILTSGTVLRNANGKAIRRIGYMQDISKQTLLEEKLTLEFASKAADKENFRLLFNSSPDVLFDIDVEKQEVIFSAAYETAFGYKITGKMTPDKDWAAHIHPDDKERVLQGYLKRMASDDTEWKYQYRFIRSDHSVANILSTGIILRNTEGKIYRLLGMMHDISKESLLEEKLAADIKLKEKQIADATEDAKEAERSAIGKELHDNVNQLLGASRMFLELAKRGGENSAVYLNRSSEYTLTAIEEIRKLTKGLATDYIKNLGLCEAIENIARDAMEADSIHISCVLNSFIENSVNDKFKLNIYRIVQEQLNNVLKHAKATKVTISLLQNKKSILLYIADNGVGFDTGKKRKGMGIANIKSRAATYHGNADFVSQPGQGCVLTVKFPLTAPAIK